MAIETHKIIHVVFRSSHIVVVVEEPSRFLNDVLSRVMKPALVLDDAVRLLFDVLCTTPFSASLDVTTFAVVAGASNGLKTLGCCCATLALGAAEENGDTPLSNGLRTGGTPI